MKISVKKYLLIALALFASCVSNDSKKNEKFTDQTSFETDTDNQTENIEIKERALNEEVRTESIVDQLKEDELSVIEYDGCQYLMIKDNTGTNKGYGFMAHKGNCKNPIHQCCKTDSNIRNIF